jgi:hypothetical protein
MYSIAFIGFTTADEALAYYLKEEKKMKTLRYRDAELFHNGNGGGRSREREKTPN